MSEAAAVFRCRPGPDVGEHDMALAGRMSALAREKSYTEYRMQVCTLLRRSEFVADAARA